MKSIARILRFLLTYKAIRFGNGMFMAVGNGGKVITSPDGITWAVQSLGFYFINCRLAKYS